ncbi:MAG TPA: M20/M25/M40 family metallo-hydrolase [Candidatus Poseidoniales archaeon]|nr:M20/M25/M40 family metallo-hydrolase [Candidatus Poseidoniales archaeon]
MSSMGYQDMTSAELTAELKRINLPSSGKKGEKLARLEKYEQTESSVLEQEVHDAVLVAEISENSSLASRMKASREVFGTQIPMFGILVVTLLLLSVAGGGIIGIPALMSWLEDEPEYTLIDFDPAQARDRASHLVSLGHPQWDGRMSGSQEELAAAESNKQNFTEYGMSATLEVFDVPMFEIQSPPSIFYCIPGTYPWGQAAFPCGIEDFNAQQKEFQHRTDYVIQGYSGTGNYQFGDNLNIINLSNGSDDTLWSQATGEVGMVWGSAGVGSNTDIYAKAIQSDLAALFLVNVVNNCGKVVADDCVPIFKTVDIEGLMDQTGGNLPETIPFVQLSKKMGEELSDLFEQRETNDVKIGIEVDVDNQGTRPVRVPCGIIQGDDDKLIIFGAHHDTVYNGPGAIDDTSGTASVLELARQFGIMFADLGTPKHTIKFCTWGGEEEGLHGSKAWVEKYQKTLADNLIIYINLDMNHVDIDPVRGNSLTLFGNYQSDVDQVTDIVSLLESQRPELTSNYTINIRTLDGEKNTPTGMPYNSDHGPFVYDTMLDDNDKPGHALVCYGSGSYEYHTYADDMTRFNEESLAISSIVYGTYARYLAWGEV